MLEIVGREADGVRRCALVGCGMATVDPSIDLGRGSMRIAVTAQGQAVVMLLEMSLPRSWLVACASRCASTSTHY